MLFARTYRSRHIKLRGETARKQKGHSVGFSDSISPKGKYRRVKNKHEQAVIAKSRPTHHPYHL